MIVVMKSHCSDTAVKQVVELLESQGLTAHLSQGVERTVIGVPGSSSRIILTLGETVLCGERKQEEARINTSYPCPCLFLLQMKNQLLPIQGEIEPHRAEVFACMARSSRGRFRLFQGKEESKLTDTRTFGTTIPQSPFFMLY
jgi:hypothetical protein